MEHPVGFHVDFIWYQPVLENKVCFRLPNICDNLGRGGDGERSFVFALLDSQKKNSFRKAVYRALNGHHIIGERATEFNLQSFCGMFDVEDILANEVGKQESQQRIECARQDWSEAPHMFQI